MAHERFRIQCTPEGGVSMGYSMFELFHECPRHFYLQYVHGGDGVEVRMRGVSIPLLYGKLWHAGKRGRIIARPDALSFAEVFDEDEQHAAEWDELAGEVRRDLDWFERQPTHLGIDVLGVEREEHARIGRHEMRGTLDLAGALDGEWGGHRLVLDWKTCDAAKVNDRRIYQQYKSSGQMTFYMALDSLARPDAPPTTLGLVVVVPRFAQQLEDKLAAGKSKAQPPQVLPIWASRTEHHLERMVRSFVRTADHITQLLDEHPRDLEGWEEHRKACVVWGVCPMLHVCDAEPDLIDDTIETLYQRRTFKGAAQAVLGAAEQEVRL